MSNTNFKRGMGAIGWIVAIIVIVVIVIVAWRAMSGDKTTPSGNGATASSDNASLVAKVNGDGISKESYEKRLQITMSAATSGGLDVKDEKVLASVRNQTINDLIAEELFIQNATKEGIKIEPSAVDAQIERNRASFADEASYQVALVNEGFTSDSFKSLITKQLIIQEYLSSKIDRSKISVSEDEIKVLYDSVAKTNTSVPPFAEVKEEVRAQIINQKSALLVQKLVEELRASSKIEIFM